MSGVPPVSPRNADSSGGESKSGGGGTLGSPPDMSEYKDAICIGDHIRLFVKSPYCPDDKGSPKNQCQPGGRLQPRFVRSTCATRTAHLALFFFSFFFFSPFGFCA